MWRRTSRSTLSTCRSLGITVGIATASFASVGSLMTRPCACCTGFGASRTSEQWLADAALRCPWTHRLADVRTPRLAEVRTHRLADVRTLRLADVRAHRLADVRHLGSPMIQHIGSLSVRAQRLEWPTLSRHHVGYASAPPRDRFGISASR